MSNEILKIRAWYNKHAAGYDDYYRNFKGAVEHSVEWELIKKYLPKNKSAKILDAAGGTGRFAVQFAKMGYSVTLCDISAAMLNAAKKKMLRERVSGKVTFIECDVRRMPFSGRSFDFVLCCGGGVDCVKELAKVTKKKGKILMCVTNRFGMAIDKFRKDPGLALRLLSSKINIDYYEGLKYRVLNGKEAEEIFRKNGIRTIELCGPGVWDSLSIPENILQSTRWNEKFFRQAVRMISQLAKEPSVKGITTHWVMCGEKI